MIKAFALPEIAEYLFFDMDNALYSNVHCTAMHAMRNISAKCDTARLEPEREDSLLRLEVQGYFNRSGSRMENHSKS